jgi:hypothetical protein
MPSGLGEVLRQLDLPEAVLITATCF